MTTSISRSKTNFRWACASALLSYAMAYMAGVNAGQLSLALITMIVVIGIVLQGYAIALAYDAGDAYPSG